MFRTWVAVGVGAGGEVGMVGTLTAVGAGFVGDDRRGVVHVLRGVGGAGGLSRGDGG